ncbi:MAG: hypothetical protein PVI01_05235 [Gemmatimonadales bacterium]|jgi:hypothetical protein
MAPEAIAGAISSSMFAAGNIPMLVKATRTRSLSSYSQMQLAMGGTANIFHWFYISSLPFGPIWFLHSFHTVATAILILLYLRYEVGADFSISRMLDGVGLGGRVAVRWSMRIALGLLLLGGASRAEFGSRVNDESGWALASPGSHERVAAPRLSCSDGLRVRGRVRSCGSADGRL